MTVVHAKAAPDDVVAEIHVVNRGPEAAPLDVLAQLVFRNTWSWGRDDRRPVLSAEQRQGRTVVRAQHAALGPYLLVPEETPTTPGTPTLLFCENESNAAALWGEDAPNATPYPKDTFGRVVVHGEEAPPVATGTKAALWWHFAAIQPGAEAVLRVRLLSEAKAERLPDDSADVVGRRRDEADAFYAAVVPAGTDAEDALVARRAFAGLLWGKQVYRYSVREWLEGDPAQPSPPSERTLPEPRGRNTSWTHLELSDVMSMPDEWEYPWFAAWDLAFHCVALAHIDPAFAKSQLTLLCREWSMHPNGQLPAYEWKFGDVNPPVHAWAAWTVYLLDGGHDTAFLERVFAKLMLNFGWWINRKDVDGSYLFEGGFLGMDNIGPFDRSADLPTGQRLEQSDATSWMAFYALSMLRIALELTRCNPTWCDVAITFLEYYLRVASAMENFGAGQVSLWDDADGFFYDVLTDRLLGSEPVRVRSMVGLLPLLGVAELPSDLPEDRYGDFVKRFDWLVHRRPDLTGPVVQGADGRTVTLSIVNAERLGRILKRLLDPQAFLSDHGIRALSAEYRNGVDIAVQGRTGLTIAYQPAESADYLFGGNSNWRGPVWFPVNVLLTDALRSYARGFAAGLAFEYPAGSGRQVPLGEIADDLEGRLKALFRPAGGGRRPSDPAHVPTGPLWQAHPTFSEYFHGDTGVGLGASHQTGWTALVAHLICRPRGSTQAG